MPDDLKHSEKGQIPTNLRLLVIFEEIAKAGQPVTPTALAEAVGLPKPTVHRLLTTAEEEGFLQRDVDGRSYGPGRRLRHLAANTLSSQRMRTERLMIMKSLAEDVGETCNLAAPGRHGMVYLDRVETHWPLRIQLPAGTQVPFHCTASGKTYLASLRRDKLERLLDTLTLEQMTDRTITDPVKLSQELSATRARGYALDHCEFMDGMTAIAVPIRDSTQRLLTTLSIHAPVQRQSQQSLIGVLPKIQDAVRRLEALCND